MSFSREQTVKATRKPNRCDACETVIEIGSPAVRWSGMSEGEFCSLIYHADCREAEIALNDLHGPRDPDEWIGLWDLDYEDIPWLIEEYPAVARRKGLAAKPDQGEG